MFQVLDFAQLPMDSRLRGNDDREDWRLPGYFAQTLSGLLPRFRLP